MNLDTINNLNFEDIGGWPRGVKIISAILLFALILALGWFLHHKNQQEQLLQIAAKESELKTSFELKQKKSANLNALELQLGDIKQSFGDLLKRLPDKTEVAGLLVDISQQGLGAGLDFELFKPGKEKSSDYYVELPVEIRVKGDYHAFGQFISGVADLPRIVTQHNVRIFKEAGNDDQPTLVMESIAKTYRYIGDEEEVPQEVAAK